MTRPATIYRAESLLPVMLLAGCAVPATQVSVPTESMHDALQQARAAHRTELATGMPLRRSMRSAAPPGAPQPMLAPPDVRMAYLYEWVDAEGNKHFGSWIAIPLAGFDWVMTDGSNPPLGLLRSDPGEPEPPQ
jgi:hypothetical protein